MPTPIAGSLDSGELLEALGEVLGQHRAAMSVESKIAETARNQRMDGLERKLAELKTSTVGLHRGSRSVPPMPSATLMRAITSRFIATARKHVEAEDIAAVEWPGRNDVAEAIRSPSEWWRMRAATFPAQTTVAGWASELAGSRIGPIMSLTPASALSRLAARAALRLDFDGAGTIPLPGRVASALPGGGFVGENSAIPTRQMNFATGIAAAPFSVKAITLATKELARHGAANVMAILADALAQDLELSIDSVLVSDQAAGALHPAGLLYSVVAIPTPSTSDLVSQLALTLGDLVAAISPAADPAFLVAPSDMALISVLAPGIASSLISSATLPTGTIIAVDAVSLYFAEDASAFAVETAEEALLHSEDTAASPIVGDLAAPPALADVATPVRSLFQTACVAIRLLGQVSWGTRRPGAVACIENWRG